VLIGLVVAWIAIWWCLRNGIKSVEKVIKWTVFLPLVLLVILAIRGLTLPGGVEGINYLLTPDFTRLGDLSVWAAAFGQVFFSYSILFGIMIAYSSYLPKETDIPSNALVIGFADSLISFVAGFAVFSVLGFMSQSTGTPIAEMGHMGVGLAFATYPEAMSMLPGGLIVAAVFAVMFFIMLFTLGIDSAFSIVEGVVTAVTDKFKTNRRKTLTIVCVIGFLVSLLFATKAGLYWLDIIDHWVNDFNLIAIGVMECIAVGWIFGSGKLRKYANENTSFKIGAWWDVLIRFVTPLVLLYIAVNFIITNIANPYGGYDQIYLIIGGWGMVALTVIAGFVLTFIKGKAAKEEKESE
jgi:NSS family neurotransmitter:Na+ symporter